MTKKAVLDSSALLSAFITPKGPAGQLIRAAHRGVFHLCLSVEIIEETAGVLVRPKITDRYRRKPMRHRSSALAWQTRHCSSPICRASKPCRSTPRTT